MDHGWLAKAGPYRIAHIPCPHPGEVDERSPAKGVLHTTEGSYASALSIFRRANAPHFLVGPRKIAQLVPLGSMAAALVHFSGPPTNGVVRVQIEIAGFSRHSLWLPVEEILDPLAALMGTLVRAAGIPLRRVSNPYRHQTTFEFATGWMGHADVPQNRHWDPGELDYRRVLDRSKLYDRHPYITPSPRRGVVYELVRRINGLVYTEPHAR